MLEALSAIALIVMLVVGSTHGTGSTQSKDVSAHLNAQQTTNVETRTN